MISVAEIRAAVAKRQTERKPLEVPNWGLTGERAIRFRNLNEEAYKDVRARVKKAGELPEDDSSPVASAFFVEMVAACAVDSEGFAFLDSEEGRALLADVDVTPHPMLLKLAEEAIEVNGLGELKGG